jgi:hypothetical protein
LLSKTKLAINRRLLTFVQVAAILHYRLVEQVVLALLYPDGTDEAGAEVVGESDDIKAEMSSWPLSGRTRDDEPTCTVFAYDEMYLYGVLEGVCLVNRALNSPVLLLGAPVRDISSCKAYGKGSARPRSDGYPLKASKYLRCVVRSTETDVELGNFVTSDISGIRDSCSDSEHSLVEIRVASRRSTSGKIRLSATVVGALRVRYISSVLRIVSGVSKVGRVQARVDECLHKRHVRGAEVLARVVRDGAIGRRNRCITLDRRVAVV